MNATPAHHHLIRYLTIKVHPDGRTLEIIQNGRNKKNFTFEENETEFSRFLEGARLDSLERLSLVVEGQALLPSKQRCLERLLWDVSVLIPSTCRLMLLLPSHVVSVEGTLRILRLCLFEPFRVSECPVTLKAKKQSMVIAGEVRGRGFNQVEILPIARRQGGHQPLWSLLIQEVLLCIPLQSAHMHLHVLLLRTGINKALFRSQKTMKLMRLWVEERGEQFTSLDEDVTQFLKVAISKKKPPSPPARQLRYKSQRVEPRPNEEVDAGTLCQLEILLLENITMSVKHLTDICQELPKNRTIKRLAFKNCCLETHLPDDADSTKRRKLLETILRTNKVLQTIKFDLFDASGKPMQLIDSSDSAITTSVRSAVSRNTTLTSLSLHEGLPDAIQAQLDGNFFRSNSLVAVEDDYETRRTIVEMVVEADSYADRRPLANRVYQLLRQKPSVLLNCSRQLQD